MTCEIDCLAGRCHKQELQLGIFLGVHAIYSNGTLLYMDGCRHSGFRKC